MLTKREVRTSRATRSITAKSSKGLCGARFRVVADHIGSGAAAS